MMDNSRRFYIALSSCWGLLVCILLGTTACVSQQEYQYLRAEYDSIAMLNLWYQDQSYETDSLVASVISGFQELSHIETMINVNTLRGHLPASEQVRIRRNVKLLSDRLEQSNQSIEQLIRRIEDNGNQSQRMRGTVALLRQQLTRQQARVSTIAEETLSKIKHIRGLEHLVYRLQNQANQIREHNRNEEERLKLFEDSLNLVRYAMGTKDDLREMGLLRKNDRVSVDNAEMSYLTQSDRRTLREVSLMSKTGRLLTIHPSYSYKFNPDTKGYLTLEILDPLMFWAYSHIMLLEVDF